MNWRKFPSFPFIFRIRTESSGKKIILIIRFGKLEEHHSSKSGSARVKTDLSGASSAYLPLQAECYDKECYESLTIWWKKS